MFWSNFEMTCVLAEALPINFCVHTGGSKQFPDEGVFFSFCHFATFSSFYIIKLLVKLVSIFVLILFSLCLSFHMDVPATRHTSIDEEKTLPEKYVPS